MSLTATDKDIFLPQEFNKADFRVGSIVSGTVLFVDKHQVILDCGFKSEAFIPIAQFESELDLLEVGATFKLYVVNVDNGRGESIFSRIKARDLDLMQLLNDAFVNQTTIKCKVVQEISHDKIRSGFNLAIGNIRGFLPFSLSGLSFWGNDNLTLGEEISVKITNISSATNSFVASRKAVSDESNLQNRDSIIKSLKVGDIVTARVKNLVAFGAFVEFNNIDSLIHISQISWKRISHPSDVLSIGQELKAAISSIEGSRVFLSIKQFAQNPWIDYCNTHQAGAVVTGRVLKFIDYGCIISLADGVQGLLPAKYIDWRHRNSNPRNHFFLGEEITCKIVKISSDPNYALLNYRDCHENPWTKFIQHHKVNDVVTGSIKLISNFGLFCKLNSNIEGMVYLGDIARQKKLQSIYQPGEQLDLVIKSIDEGKMHISLTLKEPKAEFIELLSVKLQHSNITSLHVLDPNVQPQGIKVACATYITGYLKTNATESIQISKNNTIEGLFTLSKEQGNFVFRLAKQSEAVSKQVKTTLGSLIQEEIDK